MQELIAFIEAPALEAKRRMVEELPALLSHEADDWLAQLATAQDDEEMQRVIEAHRALLARCRAVGIAAAFEEIGEIAAQSQELTFETLLNEVCDEVVALLIEGDAVQRAELADYLTDLAGQPLPIQGAGGFARLLAAWLRGEAPPDGVAALPEPFRVAYEAMAETVAEAEGDWDEGEEDEVLHLLAIVAALLTQGTTAEQAQMAEHLAPMQAEAAEQDAALATFLGYLMVALRGEPVGDESLEAPYAELWAVLQEAMAQSETMDDENEMGTGGGE